MIINFISILVKSFINVFLTPVSFSDIIFLSCSVKINMLDNFFANVLPFIKSFTKLALNITYKK